LLPLNKWSYELASVAERMAFLFTLYQEYTSLLPAAAAPKKRATTGQKRKAKT
jgi:hypothetical protein